MLRELRRGALKRLRGLEGYGELILNLVLRDVREKYRGTILGYFWTLLTPLALMCVFIFIFTWILPMEIPQYPVYLLTGLLVWTFFSSSIQDAVHALRGGGDLLKRVPFPAEVFPLTAVLTNLVTFCMSLLLLAPFMLVYDVPVTARLLWLPVLVLWQALLCLGIGMLGALSHVFFRDTGPMIATTLNVWFYATPIFYVTSGMSEGVRAVFYLNPAAVIVDLDRWAVMGTALPPSIHVVLCAAVTLTLPLAAFALYDRWAHHVAKIL